MAAVMTFEAAFDAVMVDTDAVVVKWVAVGRLAAVKYKTFAALTSGDGRKEVLARIKAHARAHTVHGPALDSRRGQPKARKAAVGYVWKTFERLCEYAFEADYLKEKAARAVAATAKRAVAHRTPHLPLSGVPSPPESEDACPAAPGCCTVPGGESSGGEEAPSPACAAVAGGHCDVYAGAAAQAGHKRGRGGAASTAEASTGSAVGARVTRSRQATSESAPHTVQRAPPPSSGAAAPRSKPTAAGAAPSRRLPSSAPPRSVPKPSGAATRDCPNTVAGIRDACWGGEVWGGGSAASSTPSCSCSSDKFTRSDRPRFLLVEWRGESAPTWEPFHTVSVDVPGPVAIFLVLLAAGDVAARGGLLDTANQVVSREYVRSEAYLREACTLLQGIVGMLAVLHDGLRRARKSPPDLLLLSIAALVRLVREHGAGAGVPGPDIPTPLVELAGGWTAYKAAAARLKARRWKSRDGAWGGDSDEDEDDSGDDDGGDEDGKDGGGDEGRDGDSGSDADGGGSDCFDEGDEGGGSEGDDDGGGEGALRGSSASAGIPCSTARGTALAAPCLAAAPPGAATSDAARTPFDSIRAAVVSNAGGPLRSKHARELGSGLSSPPSLAPLYDPSYLLARMQLRASRRRRRACRFSAPSSAPGDGEGARGRASSPARPLCSSPTCSGAGGLGVALDALATDVRAGGGPAVEMAYTAYESA